MSEWVRSVSSQSQSQYTNSSTSRTHVKIDDLEISHFDVKHRHLLLVLGVISTCTVYCLWYEFQDQIEVYFIAIIFACVEKLFQGYHVRMRHVAHDLKLAILRSSVLA